LARIRSGSRAIPDGEDGGASTPRRAPEPPAWIGAGTALYHGSIHSVAQGAAAKRSETPMDRQVAADFLANAVREFRLLKGLADDAIAQLDDVGFFNRPDGESNTVAVMVKHMAGNMRSRWTDLLTSDGEKPDRDRDAEFDVRPGETREVLHLRWESGWRALFDALGALEPADLLRTVHIRNEPHSVLHAIHRQLVHYAYHVGQIVFLAKQQRGAAWRTLSIPRGASKEFTARVRATYGDRPAGRGGRA
jgi:hypothetical protein